MKSVHSITGIPGSKKKRLPKNSGVFLLVSDSHTLGFPNPERLRRSEVCRMDIYHIGMGIAEDFSSCTPKVLQELEEIVDNRRKELLAQ